jgi:hypothetical protein
LTISHHPVTSGATPRSGRRGKRALLFGEEKKGTLPSFSRREAGKDGGVVA